MSLDTLRVDGELRFDQTWSKLKAHRRSVAEVFITDAKPIGSNTVRVGAQTPACHLYFGDHSPNLQTVDPLLIAEICRQAGLITAYELGVPDSTTLATEDWNLEFIAADGPPWGEVSDLEIDSVFEWTKSRRGIPRSGKCQQHVYYDGRQIAKLSATSNFLTRDQVAGIRLLQRGDAPPWSHTIGSHGGGTAVPPGDVGRNLAMNVVLDEIAVRPDSGQARLAPPFSNRALFDHSYDHIPMQVLCEAAGQISIAVASQSTLHSAHRMLGIKGRFNRFVELDQTATVEAEMSTIGGVTTSDIRIEQMGLTPVTFSLTYSGDPL